MLDNPKFKIAFYLAWCGAEAEHQFDSPSQYNAVCARLNKIAKAHIHGDELPPAYSKSVADFYIFEKDQRDAFQAIMQNL